MNCKLKDDECEMYCQCKQDRTLCPNYINPIPPGNINTPKKEETITPETTINEELKQEKPKDQLNSNSEKIIKSEETETGKERDVDANYKVGPGNPPKETQFTKDRQPDPEAKKNGWMKKRFSRDMIRSMMEAKVHEIPEDLKPDLIAYYGPEILESLTHGQLVVFKQLKKAATKDDTLAANFVLEHGIGRPVQAVAQSDINGNDLPRLRVALPEGMSIDFPSTTEGTDKKGQI